MREDDLEALQKQAALCVSRLERISADSIWAHRASGVRGALLRSLDDLQSAGELPDQDQAALLSRLNQNLAWGFWLLEQAAREMIT